jgi:Potassium-transporting ATPase A subunit
LAQVLLANGHAYHAQFRFGGDRHRAPHRPHQGLCPARAQTIGNFWVDMTRTVLYVLLPISIVVGLFFVWQGALPRRRRDFMPFDGRSL